MSQSVVESNLAPLGGSSLGVVADRVVRVLGGKCVLDGLDLYVPASGRVGIVGRSAEILLLRVEEWPLTGPFGMGWALAWRAGELQDLKSRLERIDGVPATILSPEALPSASILTQARHRAAPLFAQFGLAGAELLRPAKLSGGMRQRVAFLRTLLAGKPVLLLDEPFGALDAITRAELQEWLAVALAAEPRTVLLVTHDVEEALLLCERVLVLAAGRVAAEFEVDVPRDAPRREIVTSSAFVELRERALEAIE